LPGEAELAENPRARSAKMRVAEKRLEVRSERLEIREGLLWLGGEGLFRGLIIGVCRNIRAGILGILCAIKI
jgi:hypothetical protein